MSIEKLTNLDRLCVHTITNKPWSIEEIIDNYPRAEVKAVSVWRDLLQNRDASKIGAQIRDAGMEVASLVRGGFFTGKTEGEIQASLDDNRRAIDEASALGAPMIVLVCGAIPGQSIQRSLSQIQTGLETLLPYAETCGVKLGIEPLHPMYADSRSAICTLKTANEFAERYDSPYIGVVVDVFHLWWDPDLESECKRCGDHGNLFAFHICDWKMDMEDMLNDRGLMGEGVIRLREIRSWVEAAGFNGFHEVEIFSNRLWEGNQKEALERIKQAYLEYA